MYVRLFFFRLHFQIAVGSLLTNTEDDFADDPDVSISCDAESNLATMSSSGSHASATAEDRKLDYQRMTEPAPKIIELLHVDGRFVCPVPGCGQSFLVHSTAFNHLSSHERKRRLGVPTPLPDSVLNSYWPIDAPWKSNHIYTEEVIPDRKIVCPVPGCRAKLDSELRLRKHLQELHKNCVLAARSKSRFLFLGKYLLVPPFDPPADTPIMWCSNHFPKHRARCPLCVSARNNRGPKPPLKFYESVKINFKDITGQGGDVTYRQREPDKGVLYHSVNRAAHSVRGRVLEVVFDHDGLGWLAVQRLADLRESSEKCLPISRDFDIDHELIPLPPEKYPCDWISIDDLEGLFFFLVTSKRDFKYRLNNNLLPLQNIYFIRNGEDT